MFHRRVTLVPAIPVAPKHVPGNESIRKVPWKRRKPRRKAGKAKAQKTPHAAQEKAPRKRQRIRLTLRSSEIAKDDVQKQQDAPIAEERRTGASESKPIEQPFVADVNVKGDLQMIESRRRRMGAKPIEQPFVADVIVGDLQMVESRRRRTGASESKPIEQPFVADVIVGDLQMVESRRRRTGASESKPIEQPFVADVNVKGDLQMIESRRRRMGASESKPIEQPFVADVNVKGDLQMIESRRRRMGAKPIEQPFVADVNVKDDLQMIESRRRRMGASESKPIEQPFVDPPPTKKRHSVKPPLPPGLPPPRSGQWPQSISLDTLIPAPTGPTAQDKVREMGSRVFALVTKSR